MRAVNPATGEVIGEYAPHGAAETARRVERAAAGFARWRRTTFTERRARMAAVAAALRDGAGQCAATITAEMGKPIGAARAEVEKCAWAASFYAERAEEFLAPEPVETDARKSFIRYDPLGPILAVMPWNFPFWQVFRFAAPALMAGNTALLKHASNVPGCALAIEDVFRRAGFPEEVFQTLLIGPAEATRLLARDEIRAVTLTGSDRAGAEIAAEAGRRLKKAVLELGGSDPFVVLADADLDQAADAAVVARTQNAGQSCIAAKRFVLEAPIAEAFAERLVERFRALSVGDPLDPATDVGPLARADLVDVLHGQVTRSVARGARVLFGGDRRPGPGFFYAPTILAGVEPGMAAFDEETFGPVAALTTARDADHAVELANRSPFGLGASLWTDAARGEALAPEIEAGSVFVNGIVKSDPRLPFGGVKRSGYGRELSVVGIREFVNVRTVWIA